VKPPSHTSVLRTNWATYGIRFVGLAAAYFISAQIGLLMPHVGNNVTLFWPPTGIAVAFLYRYGLRYWPAVFVAALAVNLDLNSWWAAVGIAAGNTLAPAGAAWLLHLVRFDSSIAKRADIFRFVVVGAFGPMSLSAFNGACWLVLDGAPPDSLTSIFSIWWLSDSVGVLVFGLPLLAIDGNTLASFLKRPTTQTLGLGTLVAACFVCYGSFTSGSHFPGLVVLIPVVILIALTVRFGLSIGAIGGVLVASVAVYSSASGTGPFVHSDPQIGSFRLWAFIAGLTALNLLLASLLAERDSAKVAFQTSDRMFRLLVGDNPSPICEFDRAGTVRFANKAYTRAVGRSVQLVGRPFLEGTSHDPATLLKELSALSSGGKPLSIEVQTRAHDNPRWHRWSVHATDDSQGRTTGYQAVGMDITELRRVEEDRRALDTREFENQKAESLSIIAGGIAHEFNNLLTVIIGNAELTAMTLPNDAPARTQLDQIEIAARRATDLTRQLLAYAGKNKLQPRPTDLNLLLRELRLHDPLPPNAALHIAPGENLPKVSADETQLRQLVVNLLANAVEALEGKAGTVTISTDSVTLPATDGEVAGADDLPPGRYVRLSVEDNGTGMSEETKARIFEPFFTTKFTGRGLGLSAVHGIVRTHNGTVTAASRLGLGTKITALLPAEAAALSEPVRPVALVIDADEGDCVPGHRALTDLGWDVAFAADSDNGVRLFRQTPQRFGLVLIGLDQTHEAETGTLEAIREIRSEVPILVCARLTEYSLPDLTPYRPAAFLLKPYGTADVREALERIKRSRAGRVGNGH